MEKEELRRVEKERGIILIMGERRSQGEDWVRVRTGHIRQLRPGVCRMEWKEGKGRDEEGKEREKEERERGRKVRREQESVT